jgi:hypothetical protein
VVDGRQRSLLERVGELEKTRLPARQSLDHLADVSRDLGEVVARSESELEYLEACEELDEITPSVPPMLPEARAEQSGVGRNLYLTRSEGRKSLRADRQGGAVGPDDPAGRAVPTGIVGVFLAPDHREDPSLPFARVSKETARQMLGVTSGGVSSGKID